GKFGNAKRKGTLARVMAKLKHTSLSVINIALIVLNLDTRLREVLFWICGKLEKLEQQLRQNPRSFQIEQAAA
ncbi:MAG: hypothetical protein ACI8XO_004318, partial [Verrucomicrobiales bacterium]